MYIVLQDGSTKSETPRSIAYELNTGGIKICSEKAVHVAIVMIVMMKEEMEIVKMAATLILILL